MGQSGPDQRPVAAERPQPMLAPDLVHGDPQCLVQQRVVDLALMDPGLVPRFETPAGAGQCLRGREQSGA